MAESPPTAPRCCSRDRPVRALLVSICCLRCPAASPSRTPQWSTLASWNRPRAGAVPGQAPHHQQSALLLLCSSSSLKIAYLEHRDPLRWRSWYYAFSARPGIDHILTRSPRPASRPLGQAGQIDTAPGLFTMPRAPYPAIPNRTSSGESVTEMSADWERTNRSPLSRAHAMLAEIVDRGVYDVKSSPWPHANSAPWSAEHRTPLRPAPVR
jgi:hypothetical protein